MTTPPKKMSFNDLETWLNERRVTEIECLVPDLTGVARGKILPREKFTEDRGRLPQGIVCMGVTGEFPVSGPYYDVVDPTDKDMQLRPVPESVRLVPWASSPTAQVIHDCDVAEWRSRRDRTPRVCAVWSNSMRKQGWAPVVVAPELEFYLTKTNPDPDIRWNRRRALGP